MIRKVAHIGTKVAVHSANVALTRAGLPELYGSVRPPDFSVDLSKDVIVLWVPGTSNHSIPEHFSELIKSKFPSVDIHLVDYMASWTFSKSRPNGISNLTLLLDYLSKHLRKGQKILLAGESQGAWIISDVLSDKKYRNLVDKVALLGHPGLAKGHFENDPKVLEINHPQDVSTLPISGETSEEVARNVEKIVHFDLSSLPFWLKVGITHPNLIVWLGVLGISQIPVVGGLVPEFHDYRKDMLLAVLWLSA